MIAIIGIAREYQLDEEKVAEDIEADKRRYVDCSTKCYAQLAQHSSAKNSALTTPTTWPTYSLSISALCFADYGISLPPSRYRSSRDVRTSVEPSQRCS